MAGKLDGTVALITGASSGIGAASARALAAQGAAVALVARRLDRLHELAVELDAQGARTLVVEADLTDRAQATDAIERTVRELGRLDTVINNAGVMLLGMAESSPVEEWENMIHVNLLGLLYVARAALPHLVHAASGGPRRVSDLVNISSVAGRVARSGSAVYNLTKFGVVAFSEALRQEVAERHVRVSIVEPGAVRTELISHNRPEVQGALEKRLGSMERLEAEDIAEAILFIVTRARHVAVNEMLVRPTEQLP